MMNIKNVWTLCLSVVFSMVLVVFIPWVLANEMEANAEGAPSVTHYVATDGVCGGMMPCYDAIQTAVNAATDGDEILIASGTYSENVQINTDLTIQGAGTLSTTVSGTMSDTVFVIVADTAVTITNITLADGMGECRGGGLQNHGTVILDHTILRDNVTSCGGAGINNGGTITINNSLIVSNTSSLGGGGLHNEATGVVEMNHSTIRSNIDLGLYNRGGTVILNSSTVNDNAYGFSVNLNSNGLYNDGGSMMLNNSTLSNNNLAIENGVVSATNSTLNDSILYSNGSASLQNSIVVACQKVDGGTGNINSLGYNVGQDASCGLTANGDRQNADLMLAPLADNGGETETHKLLWGSPAIDGANAEACANAPINGVDQRGVARTYLNGCDIGAFELDIVLDENAFLPIAITP